jgi:hypothetical protein
MRSYKFFVYFITDYIFKGESLCQEILRERWMEIDINLVPLMSMVATNSQQTFVIKVGSFIVLSYEFFLQLIGVVITYFLVIVPFKA